MKNNYYILITILFSILALSCNDETNNLITSPIDTTLNRDTFKYPYSINSSWYYTTRNFVTNVRPDSLLVYFPPDTLIGYGDASFIKDTVLNNKDTVRLLRNSHSEPQHSHTTLEYYNQTDSGLIRVAFYSDGANFGPYRPAGTHLTYSLNGRTFNSLNEIYENYNIENSKSGTLIFDDPPIKAVKYPIVTNEEWDFVNYGTTRITKKFTDFVTLTLPGGTFYCIKIQKNWYYNSPTPDTNYISIDYFSKEGMVKRDFRIKDVLISNQNGPIGYIDVKEEANLNLYSLP